MDKHTAAGESTQQTVISITNDPIDFIVRPIIDDKVAWLEAKKLRQQVASEYAFRNKWAQAANFWNDAIGRTKTYVQKRVRPLAVWRSLNTRLYDIKRYARRVRQRLHDSIERIYHRCVYSNQIRFESGDNRAHKREMREKIQRDAEFKKSESARKSTPKVDREKEIKQSRCRKLDYLDLVEFQSGDYLDECPAVDYSVLVPVASAFAGALATMLSVKAYNSFRKVDTLVQRTQDFVSLLTELATGIKRVLGKALWAVPVVMLVYFSMRHFNITSGPVQSMLVAALTTVIGEQMWNGIRDVFLVEDVQLQSGLIDIAPKLIATVFTFSVFNKKVSPAVITEFCRRISMLDRMSIGWETFLAWMLEALETCINSGMSLFGDKKIELYEKTSKPAVDWAKQIDVIVMNETVSPDIDADKLDKMVELVCLGYGFKDLYRGTRMSKMIDDYLIKISSALQPYMGALNARNNFRFEPAACMLHGSPGIGKTLMAMPFCASILLLSGLLPPGSSFEDVAKNVWQKGTSEYWNSYSNQLCLVMDDAFQTRANSNDKENDYIGIIRMVGTWSFPLNFADLASKGKIFFGSKFIFGTTNLRSFDSEARQVLQEPAAVARRLNFSYTLRVINVFQKDGKLDYDLFERELIDTRTHNKGIDAFPWYIWEVRKHDFITGQDVGEWLPIKQLILDISADLRKRRENHTLTKDFLSDFVTGFSEIESQVGGYLPMRDLPYRPRVLNRPMPPPPPTAMVRIQRAARDGWQMVTGTLNAGANLLSDWVDDYLNNLRELSLGWKLFCVGFGTLLGSEVLFPLLSSLLTGAWDFLKNLFIRANIKPQSNRPATKPQARPRAVLKPDDVKFQSADSAVATNVYANTYKMYMHISGNVFVVGQITFLMSDLAVQPEHFTDTIKEMLGNKEIDDDTEIFFRNSSQPKCCISITVKKYLSLERVTHREHDVEFIKFEGVRAHRNILRNFMKENDLKYLNGVRARLDVCCVDNGSSLKEHNDRNVQILPSIKLGRNLPIINRRLERYYGYSADTTVGDCGAPLSVFDNSLYSGRTVIGLHVAGYRARGLGYSSIVTQEMIEAAALQFNTVIDDSLADLERRGIAVTDSHELPFLQSGSFLPLYQVDRPVIICPKTSYYPTQYYGTIGEYDHHPAPLRPVYRDGELKYPMDNAVLPYSTPVHVYEQKWLKQALHVAMSPLTKLTRDYSRRLYTFEEAVLGVPQEKFRSIPRNTASGFPYVYDVRDGKKEFFGDAEDYNLTGEKALELRERVEFVNRNAEANVRLSHVFIDFLKDELRSREKVNQVATRLISSAPLDYTISWRMYFGAFSSAVMRTHTHSGMAPGICAYSEWDILAEKLREKGPKCFDGDFKAFDSSEQPCVHELILDYINAWYDDGVPNQTARRVLWLDLMHSRHIGGRGNDQRYIYQWNKSLPSGHPFTTIVNSIYALFCIVAAYIHNTKDKLNFWQHVSCVTYGDDNVTNVDEEMAKYFTQFATHCSLDDLFHLKYTPGSKGVDFYDHCKLEDMTFLKRGFSSRDNTWLCPLEPESFLYTFYWCKNKKLEKVILIDVLENALEELSMHDSQLWDAYAPKLRSILIKEAGDTRVDFSQNEYLRHVRSRTDSWY